METGSKKQHKMALLQESAYELFTSKGVHETSIDDIVRRASVAKGTFYLYFKDKYQLLDRIVLRKSAALIDAAASALEERLGREELAFEDKVIFFIDYVVNRLKRDRKLLSILHKNLADGLFARLAQEEEAAGVIARFTADFTARGASEKEARMTLYIILEMVGSVCYSAVLGTLPCSIDDITPTLYGHIRRMLG